MIHDLDCECHDCIGHEDDCDCDICYDERVTKCDRMSDAQADLLWIANQRALAIADNLMGGALSEDQKADE